MDDYVGLVSCARGGQLHITLELWQSARSRSKNSKIKLYKF